MRMPTTAAGQPAGPGLAGEGTARPRPAGGAAAWLGLCPPASQARPAFPALARRHWLLTVLLPAGLVLRVLAQIAYRPALLYIDSLKYLFGAYPGNDPLGYQYCSGRCWMSPTWLIAALQHLLGLAMAVRCTPCCCAAACRAGWPRWPPRRCCSTPTSSRSSRPSCPTSCSRPDRRRPGRPAVAPPPPHRPDHHRRPVPRRLRHRPPGRRDLPPARPGLPAGDPPPLAPPAWPRAPSVRRLRPPILAASFRNCVVIHNFGLAPYAGGSVYGRMAAAADCATLKLPAYERALCPTAQQQRTARTGSTTSSARPSSPSRPRPR